MINFMKNFKKIAGVAVFAFAFAFAGAAFASVDVPPTLKVGSMGQEVMDLQAALGGLTVDGNFGPMTKAAVVAYQSTHGLTADGLVGPMTASSINGGTTGTGTGTATGALCPNGMTLASNCTSGATAGGALSGDEGELDNFDEVSADESGFSEDEEVELFAFEMEADGSDMMVSRVDIYMGQTTTAESNNADDYFDSASLMVDGEEVATLDVEDFEEDDYDETADTDNDEFRLRFETDFTVEAGENAKVTVEFDTVNSIDTGDSDNATWEISLADDSVRAEDGTAFVDEYGLDSIEETVTVDEVDSGDLDISLSTENPEEQIVLVDDTDETDGVEVLAFDMEANDGDIMIENMVITVDDVGTLTDVNAVASVLHLFRDGEEIASESLPTGAGTSEAITFELDEEDASEGMIEDGDTAEFTVEADIENIQAGAVGDFDEGDGIVLSFTSVEAEDEAGDNVEADGSANGENITFYTVAPEVSVSGSPSITKDAGEDASAEATDDTADGTIVFTVEAVGNTIYINGDNESTDEKEGILLTNGQGGDLDVLGDYSYTVTGANVTTTNAGADNEYYTIPEGATATFTLSFHLDPSATGFFGGNVASIQFGTVSTDQDTRSASAITTGTVADDLETALVQLTDGA